MNTKNLVHLSEIKGIAQDMIKLIIELDQIKNDDAFTPEYKETIKQELRNLKTLLQSTINRVK